MRVLSTHSKLKAAVDALPPPAKGLVRVYRGQIEDYPTLIPTGVRGGQKAHDRVWLAYVQVMADKLRRDSRIRANNDLADFVLWVRAIKQHYGPGTEFIDVTHALGVAAWFALHRAVTKSMEAAYGAPGPFDPDRDVVAMHELVQFIRQTEKPGWIYALDVKPATTAFGGHGALHDLAHAPTPFDSSPRIHVQQGCLVRSDANVDGGDLRRFVVPGTPIAIAARLDGCAEVDWPAERMFPGVSRDAWYARLVSLPIVPGSDPARPSRLAPGRPVTAFHMPLPVTLVMPDREQADLEKLRQCITTIPPALAWPAAVSMATRDKDPWWKPLASATPVLVQGPALAMMPAPSSGQWNLGLLMGEFVDQVRTHSRVGAPGGAISLNNAFVEFSPLDAPDWYSMDAGGAPVTLVRGIWLQRQGLADWWVVVFTQKVPGPGMQAAQPFCVRLASDGRSLQMRLRGEGTNWSDLAAWPLAGSVIMALSILRDLSPQPKASATPYMILDDDKLLVPIFGARARLVSMADCGPALARYHRLASISSDEIYFGGGSIDAALGLLELDEGPTYAKCDARQLRLRVDQQLSGKNTRLGR